MQDYNTIIPRNVTPRYCSGMFPNSYGKILDFMHVYGDEIEEIGSRIEWLPEEEADII